MIVPQTIPGKPKDWVNKTFASKETKNARVLKIIWNWKILAALRKIVIELPIDKTRVQIPKPNRSGKDEVTLLPTQIFSSQGPEMISNPEGIPTTTSKS